MASHSPAQLDLVVCFLCASKWINHLRGCLFVCFKYLFIWERESKKGRAWPGAKGRARARCRLLAEQGLNPRNSDHDQTQRQMLNQLRHLEVFLKHKWSSYPIPHPPSPSTTLCLFPKVRSLSWFVSLSDFSHSVPLLFLIIPFTISYIPHMSETICDYPSLIDLFHSA